MSLAQILAVVQARWKWAAAIVLVCVGISATVIKLVPKGYTATATLIIRPGSMDALAAQNAQDANVPNYVATQMELITSPTILLPVVDRLHLTHERYFVAGYRGNDEAGRREFAGRMVSTAVQVTAGRGQELVYVSASAKSPGFAASLANNVVDAYMAEERRRSEGPAVERERRYSADLVALRDKVATAQDNLATFRKKHELTNISANGNDTDTETQALNNLEQQLLDAQNQRRQIEEKSLHPVTEEAVGSTAVIQLQAQLATQQTQMAQLSGTYGAQHPKTLELKAQMAATADQLRKAQGNVSDNLSTQLARARELEATYSAAVAQQRAKVLHLRDEEGEGAKLLLELESAQSVYKRALDGYDQVMFASSTDSDNVSVVSRAVPPVTPDKSAKKKLFALSIFASLALGVGGPLAFDLLFDRRIRCRDDIERSLGIPVLAQFDSLPSLPGAP